MNKIKYLFALLFAVAALSAAALAQNHSLASAKEGDTFTSHDDGFEIDLPAEWVNVEHTSNGTTYSWNVAEGSVTVAIRQFAAGSEMRSAADVAAYVDGYKSEMVKNPSVQLVASAPATIGEYHGEVFNIMLDGEKTQIVVLAWGKFNVMLRGTAHNDVPHSAELISKALSSFTFISPNTK